MKYITPLLLLFLVGCGQKSPLDILIDESVKIEYIDNNYQTHSITSDAEREEFKKYFTTTRADTVNFSQCKVILFQTRSHTIGVKYNTQCPVPYAVYPYEGKSRIVQLSPQGIEKLK